MTDDAQLSVDERGEEPEMAHYPYEAMISLGLDGLLAPEEEKELTAHLEDCPSCAALRDQLTLVDRMLSRPVTVAPPANFTVGVMARIQNYETSRSWQPVLVGILITSLVVSLLSVAVPVLVLTLGLTGTLSSLPLGATLIGYGAQVLGIIQSGAMFAFNALADWVTFLLSDPAALAVVVTALVLASTFIGLLEGFKAMRLDQTAGQQA